MISKDFSGHLAVDVRAGIHTAESRSGTVAEAGKLWLESGEAAGLERATLAAYRQHLALHIVPRIGGVKLAQLTAPLVRSFEDALRRDCSPAMVRKVLRSLGAILADAQERGLVGQNVVHGLRHRRPWQDIDLKRGELHVRQRADRYGKAGRPKSEAGERTVPLPPMVVTVLREHKLACPNGELGLAFANSRGSYDHRITIVERAFHPAQVAAGVVNRHGEAKYRGLHSYVDASGCPPTASRRKPGSWITATSTAPGTSRPSPRSAMPTPTTPSSRLTWQSPISNVSERTPTHTNASWQQGGNT